ncbi:GAF domain-containing protein [Flavobacterium sp. NRK F10]|uniref:GAF domain-containing protein n=1 Tax=Flavobacterium sp. NRK F10 TaxID=2954931 RepID=UPI002091B8E5|nr:GAF domain-containing protein [Flavobacterium sp. NRK F10]MCO6175358.1 GAF domain-containing protein [Flavobacterium sp. NRK F10]
MGLSYFSESPFKTLISFHKLTEMLEHIAQNDIPFRSAYARSLLDEVQKVPELITGIENIDTIRQNSQLISYLLSDLFPTALTHNEIKAAAIPFHNFTFNYTKRFENILQNAGVNFEVNIRDLDEHRFYVMNCCLIINHYFNSTVDFAMPLFYDIPDKKGFMRHYRILYNADFMDVIPTDKAIMLTEADINLLLDNYDDLELWKKYFPHESWILKGFGIVSLFDSTTENSLSNLKTNLLKTKSEPTIFENSFESIFRSFFKIPDLRIGFMIFNQTEKKLVKPPISKGFISSFLLDEKDCDCETLLCGGSYDNLIKKQTYFTISDVQNYIQNSGNETFGYNLLLKNISSCILAPIVKDNQLLGIIEFVSATPRALNSIEAQKIELITPFLVDTIERFNNERDNQIEAIIQREYTTIHPSVYWKFTQEAQKFYDSLINQESYTLKEIVFKDVHPLYGQIDIKGSSEHRNETVKKDLNVQLKWLLDIFSTLNKNHKLAIVEQRIFELQDWQLEISGNLKADIEQQIQRYIGTEIHPLLQTIQLDDDAIQKEINHYFDSLDVKNGLLYTERKKFDEAMAIINKKLAKIIDEKQNEAQKIYPHYYERFRTDGVEHNLYIGASITPQRKFDLLYLQNLRLWQFQTLCEMEIEHHKIKSQLPFPLEVTSLILVFNSPISIRFRMDEKRFDVDGTYNARYEVVKKRIDKAFIKNKKERITAQGKITIVYSGKHEEEEYLKYVRYLQHKNIIAPEVEQFEVQDLQGVSGLNAIRVTILHENAKPEKSKVTIDEFLKINP